MEVFTPENIWDTVNVLGIGAIFLYLFIDERKKRDQREEAHDKKDEVHTEDYKKMTGQLLMVVQNNTQAIEGLKNTVKDNTRVQKEGIKSQKTMIERFNNYLRDIEVEKKVKEELDKSNDN